ncbi:unnamed protein product [Brassica oleracea]|uniref:(rape) hypothetical protein n=1 Tax=Brassica napus TaxID=3708 RepID=A0A816JEC9_BRANA|nr:unnamed protein product [Brassica napus]
MEENFGNGREDLGKSLLVNNKGISDDPSLNGTPLMNPTLLEKDGLPLLRNLRQHYLVIAENSRARSTELLEQKFVLNLTILKVDGFQKASVVMATTQASIAMDTSQASAHSHGVYAATLTQGQ